MNTQDEAAVDPELGTDDAVGDQAFDRVYRQYLERQPRYLAIALAVTAFGVGLVYLGIRDSAVLVSVIGFLLMAGGLFPINDRVRIETGRSPSAWLSVGLALVVAGAITVVLAVRASEAVITAVGVAVVVAGLLPFGTYLRLNSRKRGQRWVWIGLGVIVAGVVLIVAGAHWIFGAAAILAGITMYRTGLTGVMTSADNVRLGLRVGAAGVVIGTILVIVGAQTGSLWALIFGAAPGTLAMHALSVAWSSDTSKAWKKETEVWKRYARPLRIVVAVVLVLTWIGICTIGDQPFLLGTAISLAIFSVGAGFVWRGESLLIVLIFGFVVVWVSLDRSVEPLPEPPDDQPQIVAVGDSYMSGEGAPEYFAHTNITGDEKNECRRAPTAYPVLVAQARGSGLQFLACSGAKAAELHMDGQMDTANTDATGRNPQFDDIDFGAEIDVILISIGGNDARFGDVGEGLLVARFVFGPRRILDRERRISRPEAPESVRETVDPVGWTDPDRRYALPDHGH